MDETDIKITFIKNRKKDLLVHITPKYILELMLSKTDVDIRNKGRRRENVYNRSIYFTLCRNFTTSTLVKIGEDLNKEKPFDHATVMHGLNIFENYKNQKWFSNYLDFYNALAATIYKESVINGSSQKRLLTTDDVRNEYKIKFIMLVDKYRNIINKQQKQIYNLKNNEIINEIASLDDDILELLKPRLKSFLLMNKKKV
ncbi:MAG: helix-turn-helix domain-containing protein [Saprospiraceae bacterium]